ncbi:interleukin-4 [Rhinichthys klamathensis goyatoka]|uniref:interleukin-4 n=1 Tax=Rhinichthys klamathensis goyatoka TaxID=3034132 RepID=UPI0024B48506|nr:interleukin-4 [Rhinichthys klamathensis goyatoka]
MEPSIRTFLLLALTLVAVNGSRPNVEKIILRETIENVEKILNDRSDRSEKTLNQFVKDIFPSGSCSKETLCQAAMVLTNTHLNHSKLQRNLFAYAEYTGHRNCSVQASVKHPMKEFLTKIKKCCQLLNNVHVK